MPFFDSLMNMMGTPDPLDEMKAYQARRVGANAAAINAPTPGAPGVDPNVGGVPAQPSVSTILPNQQPTATQTPQDLGSIIIDLTRREQAKQGWNQALGMGIGAFAQPRDREAVDKMFNVAPIDATKLGEGLMRLNSQQAGMDRDNALGQMIRDPVRGKAIADRLNISQDELIARYQADPQGVGGMIQSFAAPTEASKNYDQARAKMKAQGMTDEQINAVMPPEMLALGGVSDPGYREFVLARTRAIQSGQALPPELQDYPTYQASKAAKVKLSSDNAADLSDAQGKLAPLNQRIDETNTIVDRIKANPKLDAALTYLTTTGGMGADKAAKSGLIDPQTYQAIQDIQQLSGQVYGEGFSSTGSKRTQQEVSAIVSGLSQLKATGMSGSDYIDKALAPLQGHMQRAKGNAFGAAGSLDDAPVNTRGLIDPIYLSGGRLYSGSGGDWAKDLELSAADAAQARDLVAKGEPRERVRQHILEAGKRPPAWL